MYLELFNGHESHAIHISMHQTSSIELINLCSNIYVQIIFQFTYEFNHDHLASLAVK